PDMGLDMKKSVDCSHGSYRTDPRQSVASPTNDNLGVSYRSMRKPARTSVWSSTKRTETGTGRLCRIRPGSVDRKGWRGAPEFRAQCLVVTPITQFAALGCPSSGASGLFDA